ncbi:MAG: hypothetical protein FK734_20425 [Asgard group archaeon]|nr:hypothetical protein [Asgard group archaeon]
MKNRKLIISLGFLICIIISTAVPTKAINFNLTDETNDVYFVEDLSTTSTFNIATHPEIDINSIGSDGSKIIVTFGAAPILGENYSYEVLIYWTLFSSEEGNYTEATFNINYNTLKTQIVNSTGDVIVDHTITDGIIIVGTTLEIPLYATEMLSTVEEPNYVFVYSYFFTDIHDYYSDDYVHQPPFLIGYNNYWIAFVSLSTLVVITMIVKRKKK